MLYLGYFAFGFILGRICGLLFGPWYGVAISVLLILVLHMGGII